MKPPYEDLSRLLAGDLPEPEAIALRRRIETEPEVSAAWEELRSLVHGIAALPEERPPAALDAAVLGERPTRDLRWVAAGITLAAAALFALLIAGGEEEPARIVLLEGEQLVDGPVALVAGTVPVEIDGLARVRVEPIANEPRVEPERGVVREPGGEEDHMKRIGSGLAGVALGAVVTVAVLEGTATVHAEEGDVVVRSGQTRSFEPGSSGAGGVGGVGALPRDATPAERVAALEAENAALREQLKEAQFTSAVARGQVLQTQGTPSEWPAEVADGYAPEVFEANLRAAVEKVPGLSVRELDCSEYPCIATLGMAGAPPEDLQRQLSDMTTSLTDEEYPDASVWMGISMAKDEHGPTSAIVSVMPPETRDDPALRTRTDWRAQSLMAELEPDGG